MARELIGDVSYLPELARRRRTCQVFFMNLYWLKFPAPLCQGSRRLPNSGDKSRQNWVAGGFPGGGALVGGLPDHPDGC